MKDPTGFSCVAPGSSLEPVAEAAGRRRILAQWKRSQELFRNGMEWQWASHHWRCSGIGGAVVRQENCIADPNIKGMHRPYDLWVGSSKEALCQWGLSGTFWTGGLMTVVHKATASPRWRIREGPPACLPCLHCVLCEWALAPDCPCQAPTIRAQTSASHQSRGCLPQA